MTRLDSLGALVEALPRGKTPRPPLSPLRGTASRVRASVLRHRRRALADPPPSNGQPRHGLGLIRPGFNNLGPSAAFVFHFARRHEVAVLAHACEGEPPRPATSIDGVRVPEDLRGRLWEVGRPHWRILSFERASDLFLAQLLALAEVGLPGLSGEALLGSELTFLGHSQGALEGLLDAARLGSAGLGKVIGRVLGIAPPIGGAPMLASSRVAALTRSGAGLADGLAAARAVEALLPGEPVRILGRHGASAMGFHRVVAGRVGGGGSPFFRTLAYLSARGAPAWSELSDGMVTVASARLGVDPERFSLFGPPADHDHMFEDPAVVDEVLA